MSMQGFGRQLFGAMAAQRRAQGLPTPLLDRMQGNGHMQSVGGKGGNGGTPPPPQGLPAFQAAATGKPMAPPVMPMRPPISQGMAPAPQLGVAPPNGGMAPAAPQGLTPQLDANAQIATALMKRGRIG